MTDKDKGLVNTNTSQAQSSGENSVLKDYLQDIVSKGNSQDSALTKAPTILKQIIEDKREWITNKKTELPLESFQSHLNCSDRDFYKALQSGIRGQGTPAYILECKKASPSKGVIREDFSPAAIAAVYKNYASVISVLTDEPYFQGDFHYIKQVRTIAHQPILCKDFIIDGYQIYLARYHQADAILLMLSVLTDEQYSNLAKLAHQLGMGVLTESATEQEVQRAIALNAKVIGINNRNLHDLSVDIHRTPKLATAIPDDVIVISESGITDHSQIQLLSPYAQGFLVGSSLMAEDDLNTAVRRLVYGENKVCGLTRAIDAKDAYEAGAYYGGLIFAETSKRNIDIAQAKKIQLSAPLQYVGVFQDQSIEQVSDIAKQLRLCAVQLHGHEDNDYIYALRDQLDSTIQIWKTISINIEQDSNANDGDSEANDTEQNKKEALDAIEHAQLSQSVPVDRYVIDSRCGKQLGGTGMTFDWSIVPKPIRANSMLAGGLNINNILLANRQGFLGLDINSGAESSVGVKDKTILQNIFRQIQL